MQGEYYSGALEYLRKKLVFVRQSAKSHVPKIHFSICDEEIANVSFSMPSSRLKIQFLELDRPIKCNLSLDVETKSKTDRDGLGRKNR